LEEAHGAQTRRDKANKFSIALKEARETLYWLRLLPATGLVELNLVGPLAGEANELVAILTVTRRKLNSAKGSG
jgi:four helix bundle protein